MIVYLIQYTFCVFLAIKCVIVIYVTVRLLLSAPASREDTFIATTASSLREVWDNS